MKDYLIAKAIESYKKVCDEHTTVYNRKGTEIPFLLYQAPSWYLSEAKRKYVYLRNCNGDIARYNLKTGEITV